MTKTDQKVLTWCKHISKREDEVFWLLKDEEAQYSMFAGQMWKFCPLCGKEKP